MSSTTRKSKFTLRLVLINGTSWESKWPSLLDFPPSSPSLRKRHQTHQRREILAVRSAGAKTCRSLASSFPLKLDLGLHSADLTSFTRFIEFTLVPVILGPRKWSIPLDLVVPAIDSVRAHLLARLELPLRGLHLHDLPRQQIDLRALTTVRRLHLTLSAQSSQVTSATPDEGDSSSRVVLFPADVKVIDFHVPFDYKMSQSSDHPSRLTHLRMAFSYGTKSVKAFFEALCTLAGTLKFLELDFSRSVTVDLSPYVREMELDRLALLHTLTLKNLPCTKLTHQRYYLNPPVLSLPAALVRLKVSELDFQLPCELPSTLTHLSVGDPYRTALPPLPARLLSLKVGRDYVHALPSDSNSKNWPPLLRVLAVGERYPKFIYPPSHLAVLIIKNRIPTSDLPDPMRRRILFQTKFSQKLSDFPLSEIRIPLSWISLAGESFLPKTLKRIVIEPEQKEEESLPLHSSSSSSTSPPSPEKSQRLDRDLSCLPSTLESIDLSRCLDPSSKSPIFIVRPDQIAFIIPFSSDQSPFLSIAKNKRPLDCFSYFVFNQTTLSLQRRTLIVFAIEERQQPRIKFTLRLAASWLH